MFTVTSIFVFSRPQWSTECNFNLRYFIFSITKERLYKSFSFYKFFCANISLVELEILRTSSTIFRSSHRRCSIKNVILKHVAIFTGKHLCWGLLFSKAADHQGCNFIEKCLQHIYFLMNTRKFIKTPILKNICKQLHFSRQYFSDQTLAKGISDDLLCVRLLKLVKTEKNVSVTGKQIYPKKQWKNSNKIYSRNSSSSHLEVYCKKSVLYL